MDSVNTVTPSWLVGLLIFFALATAATFGLLLYRHAELSGLQEQYYLLDSRSKALEPVVTELERTPQLLDAQIKERRNTISQLTETEKTNIGDVERLVTHNQEILKANEEAQQKEVVSYNQSMKDAADRRKELGSEEERQYASERENDDRRREARDNIEKMSVLIEQKKKENRRQNVELEGRIDELEARVRQLTQEQDLAKREFKSAGQIVASAAADGFVVINRGHRKNLRNGTKFWVFNKRGGKIITKGQIQVIEVRDDISTARVMVENDKNDPLIVGDLLHNPVYDPDKVIHFAIRGDFQRFSSEELVQFIKDSGDLVDGDISVATDYLVAGSNCPAALAQATKLGVSILSEDQLLDFVTIKDHPVSAADLMEVRRAARAGKTFALVGKFTVADRSTVEKWIEHNGGKTTGGIKQGVDLVIAGDGADNELTQARKLGIQVIDQSQFSHLDAHSVDR